MTEISQTTPSSFRKRVPSRPASPTRLTAEMLRQPGRASAPDVAPCAAPRARQLPVQQQPARPGRLPDAVIVAGMIRAAALVATADGGVTSSEYEALLRQLRERRLLGSIAPEAVAAGFARLTRHISPFRWDSVESTLAALRPLAEDERAQDIAISAAAVALADGITWPQEVAMLRLVNRELRLRPSRLIH